jgi:DNA polymerase-3 subunit delta'
MTPQIHGHTTQRHALEKLVRSDRLPHAMVLTGPPGIGKWLVAMELARTLLCEEKSGYGGCGKCKSCTLSRNGAHPDLYALDCTAKDSSLDSLRELLYRLNLKSFGGSDRVVLLRDAESLSLAAANLLLKSLEEPKPGTFFVLTSSNPSALPATLMSRCQRWYFHELKASEIRAILTELNRLGVKELSEAQIAQVAELGAGSLSHLEQILHHREQLQSLRQDLERIVQGDATAVVTLAEALAKDKEALSVTLPVLIGVCRQLLLEHASTPSRIHWARLLEAAVKTEHLVLERNLAAATTLRAVFSSACGDPKLMRSMESFFQERNLASYLP